MSSKKNVEKSKRSEEGLRDEDFTGFSNEMEKTGCRKENCSNPIEDWDGHDFCFIHRTCISKTTHSLRPNQCPVCVEASPDRVAKLMKLLNEWRRLNGKGDQLDIFTPLPSRNFATPFMTTAQI